CQEIIGSSTATAARSMTSLLALRSEPARTALYAAYLVRACAWCIRPSCSVPKMTNTKRGIVSAVSTNAWPDSRDTNARLMGTEATRAIGELAGDYRRCGRSGSRKMASVGELPTARRDQLGGFWG